MSGYDEFWSKLQAVNPKKDITKVKKLTEGTAQAIENASKNASICADELLLGLSIGIVASFEVVFPKNRKRMLEMLCHFLRNVSKSMETGNKEDNNNQIK